MLRAVKRTVARAAPPVRKDMTFEHIGFGIHKPSGTMYAELRLEASFVHNPEQGGEPVRRRRYATAAQFLTDFCADHAAATNAWIDSQVDEVYIEPKAEE